MGSSDTETDTESGTTDNVDGLEEADADELRQKLRKKEKTVEELSSKLDERQKEIEDLESRLKRVQADFQNYKKRAEKKKEEFSKYATLDLVSELLTVKSNLDRALDEEGDIREGVEMVNNELDRILESEGVERIDTDDFDPERHEAMMRVDSEEHDEGEMVDVYEEGYVMEDRIVRPAKVTVAKGDDE